MYHPPIPIPRQRHPPSCSKRVLLLFAFTIQLFYLSAQTLPSRRYTTRDGLVADRTTVITQDQDGFMWIGSLFGLSRYDGSRFITIRLPVSQQYKYVTSLLPADNKVYAGFLFGGGLMQYHKGQLTAHFIPPAPGGTSNDIVSLCDDHAGILVVNSMNQVYRFYNNRFDFIFSLDSSYTGSYVSYLASDSKGRIWMANPKGLEIYENGNIRQVPFVKGPVVFMKATSKGIMIAWTAGGTTFFHLIDDKLQANLVWQTNNLRYIPFAGIQSDIVWGIDNTKGLFSLSTSGRMDFFAPILHPSAEIKYLFADRENNLWMAADPGILKISNVPAISYEFEELAPGGSDISRGKDSTIWCTNSKYLYRVKDNHLQKVQEFRTRQQEGYLGSILVDNQNNLWISRWDSGLWKLRYKGDQLVHREYITHFKDQQINVNCMASDEEGNNWAGGNYGIFHFRNGKVIDHYTPKRKDGSPAFITAITVDARRKELWLGDNITGLIRLSYRPNGNTYTYQELNYFDEENGLTETYIRSLVFDSKDNLWIGTRLSGIFRLTRKEGTGFQFRHYSSSNGPYCTRVTDIIEEKGKSVWFATCDRILRFSFSSEQWETYNVSDGLLGSEIFSLSLDDRNQHLWAVSGQGITDMRYGHNRTLRPAPRINITQVSILGQEDTTALFLQHHKKLSSDENSIGFTFAGTSYTDEKKIRYKYMLEGYDKDWSIPVQNNNVNYASLPFGHYTFKVLASNGDQWSEVPATFSFQVIRPFYKSFWFIALIACLLAASFYFIRVYRLKQKLKLEKLRVNIARDLHDDIGSALGSINLLSENATRRLTTTKSLDEVAGIFQKIGYSAQSMLDSMDDIIWTINPEKDSLEDLLIRMREFAIPLLEAKNISFDINMHAAEGVKPSMEIKRNIYLVFKETIFNIVRHSGSTHVTINAMFGSKAFDLTISDNGKGFNENVFSSRNGLKNMKKRADLSGASLKIDSAPGSGTTIRFHGVIR